jgi:hypothetical protein
MDSDPGAPAQTPAWSGTRGTVIAAVLTLLVLLIPLFPSFHSDGFPMDEGIVLLYPELILKGWLPYRDFETFYTPLNLWVLAGAYSVGGVHLLVERAVGLGYQLLILLGLFLLARRGGLVIAMATALLAAIILQFLNLTALAWNGGVACAIWMVVALAEPRPWRAFVGGLLGAAALLYRQDMGPAVLLCAAPLVWRFPAKLRWRFAAGFAAGLLPLAVLAVAAGPRAVFENLFLYPVFIANPGRRIPYHAALPWLQQLALLHVFACAVSLFAAFIAWRRNPRSPWLPVFLSTSLLALGLTHQGMQRMDYIHVTGTVFASIALLPWSLMILLRPAEGRSPSLAHGFACAALGLAVLALVSFEVVQAYGMRIAGAFSGETAGGEPVRLDGRAFALQSKQMARNSAAVLALLKRESAPGERLFVGGGDLRRAYANDTFLYHMTPWLTPATYFLEINPFSANRPGSRLAADVASADWLVLNHLWESWDEPNGSTWKGSDAPNAAVRERFALRATFGCVQVYRRIGVTSATAAR